MLEPALDRTGVKLWNTSQTFYAVDRTFSTQTPKKHVICPYLLHFLEFNSLANRLIWNTKNLNDFNYLITTFSIGKYNFSPVVFFPSVKLQTHL